MGQNKNVERHFHIEKVEVKTKAGRIIEKIFVICDYCGYRYHARVESPKRCASCQRDLWDWRKKD